jgi:hypothetical protein
MMAAAPAPMFSKAMDRMEVRRSCALVEERPSWDFGRDAPWRTEENVVDALIGYLLPRIYQ